MNIALYNPSGLRPRWLEDHPFNGLYQIMSGQTQAEAMLKYIIANYESHADTVTMFVNESSQDKMVKDVGYNLTKAYWIINGEWWRSLFEGFWPIGVIGVCDHEGHPHLEGLPMKEMFDIAEIIRPFVIPFVIDQTFAIKQDTIVKVRKDIYERILASKDDFSSHWEPCVARLWLSLYRESVMKQDQPGR